MKFKRQETHKKKRVKDNWRKPRGIDSKMRLQLKGKPPIVKPGYGTTKTERGTVDGKETVLIYNSADVGALTEDQVGIIGSGVGARKKITIIQTAKKEKKELLNYTEDFVRETQEKMKKKAEKKSKKKSKKTAKKSTEKTEESKESKTNESSSEKKDAHDKKETSEDKEETKKQDGVDKKEKDKILTKKGAQQ